MRSAAWSIVNFSTTRIPATGQPNHDIPTHVKVCFKVNQRRRRFLYVRDPPGRYKLATHTISFVTSASRQLFQLWKCILSSLDKGVSSYSRGFFCLFYLVFYETRHYLCANAVFIQWCHSGTITDPAFLPSSCRP
eukprot:GHVT01105081.1.p1 GENE.GHVT01105081.1~~GHVT01105081.1.p1  ORF type:complete len:135 (+),score=0.57 GHVT01105081.1:339-743(+)